MAQYTEEVLMQVTITETGDKLIRRRTIVYKDGAIYAQSNHREVIGRAQAVPAEIAALIEAKKGKQV